MRLQSSALGAVISLALVATSGLAYGASESRAFPGGFDVLACPTTTAGGALTVCRGQGPVALANLDLKLDGADLVNEEVDVDVLVDGTFGNTRNTIILNVNDRTVRLGTGSGTIAKHVALLRVTDTVKITLTTDVDGRDYTIPGAVSARLLASHATVSPTVNTLATWRALADAKALEITSLLTIYRGAKRLPEMVATTSAELEDLEETTRDKAEESLRAAGVSIVVRDLFYPAGHPDATKAGRMKDAADMPPAWFTAINRRPDLPRLLQVLANVRTARRTTAVLDPAVAQAAKENAEALLQAAVTDGTAWEARLGRWQTILNAELRDVRARLGNLLATSNGELGPGH